MRAPNLSTGNRGGIVITHREFIADIKATQAFTKTEFDLNPGMTPTFPWLAELCNSYEEYEVRGMIFEYKSLCSLSTLSTAGTLGMGSVMMATNYNPLNDPFTDKRTMENYEGCSSKRPQDSNIHVVDVSRGSTPVPGLKWVRTGPVPAGADIRLYDIGRFCIATQGQPNDVTNGSIGELWVAYDIEFFKPKVVGAIGSQLRLSHWSLPIPPGGYTVVYPFGFFNAAVPQIVGNKLNVGGILLGNRPSPQDLGYNCLRFDKSMIGMTFLMLVYQRSVTNLALSALVYDDGGSDGVEIIDGFSSALVPNTLFIGGLDNGAEAATQMAACKFKVIDDGTGEFKLAFNFADGVGSLPAAARMDIYCMQVNGTPDSITG